MGIMQRVRDGDWSHLGKPGRSKLAEFAARRKSLANKDKEPQGDSPKPKSQTCRIGGKVYKIALMRNGKKLTCGGKKRVQLKDAAKVQALRDAGGDFDGLVAGKPYKVTADMLLAANKMGVSQLMLAANRVPPSLQTPLRRKFNLMTTGEAVTKVKPERPPKPDPRPPRVPELTVDDIRQNDFTKKWQGAWAEADLPQDLLKALAKVPPPGEIPKQKGTAFHRVRSVSVQGLEVQSGDMAIHMNGFQPEGGNSSSVYRHEFGHHIDATLAKTLGIEAWRRDNGKQYEKKLAKFLRQPEQKWRALPLEERREIWNEFERRAISAIDREDTPKSLKEDLKLILSSGILPVNADGTLEVIPGITDWIKGIPVAVSKKQLMSPPEDLIPSYIKDLKGDARPPMFVSDTPEWKKALEGESRAIQEERKDADKRSPVGEWLGLSMAYREHPDPAGAAESAAKKAASENPAFRVLLSIVDRRILDQDTRLKTIQGMVFPDGMIASRAQIVQALGVAGMSADLGLGGLFDALGATTKNKVGWGHDDSYYTQGNKASATGKGRQATEVFANLTDMHAYSADSRALAEFFLPIQYAEYKRILNEYGDASNEPN